MVEIFKPEDASSNLSREFFVVLCSVSLIRNSPRDHRRLNSFLPAVIEPLTSETKAKLDTSSVPNLSIPKVSYVL